MRKKSIPLFCLWLLSMNDRSMPGVAVPSFWLVILCLAISLAGIFDHDLWTPDEPREAAIMLSMSRSGNLIVPELAGEPFVEKPPLYYAVGAGALRLLGPLLGATTAGRLTSVLWGLGALLMTALLPVACWAQRRDCWLFCSWPPCRVLSTLRIGCWLTTPCFFSLRPRYGVLRRRISDYVRHSCYGRHYSLPALFFPKDSSALWLFSRAG
jgi:hypothetical protein